MCVGVCGWVGVCVCVCVGVCVWECVCGWDGGCVSTGGVYMGSTFTYWKSFTQTHSLSFPSIYPTSPPQHTHTYLLPDPQTSVNERSVCVWKGKGEEGEGKNEGSRYNTLLYQGSYNSQTQLGQGFQDAPHRREACKFPHKAKNSFLAH